MRHTIAVLVQNHPGVLVRVSGLFSTRNFNIESLTVGETQDPDVSRMTIVASGDDKVLDQIEKQLGKLVEVIKVVDLKPDSSVARELCLIKIKALARERQEIFEVVNVFRAKIVDVCASSLTVEVTGSQPKIKAFLELVRSHGVLEMVRTGCASIGRGPKKLS